MKSLIICPAERPNVVHLADAVPLVNLSLCGKPFIFYWVEFLIQKGVTEILILAADRPEMVRRAVGDGSRWGISVEVFPERRELSPTEAREKYQIQSKDFPAITWDVNVADRLPRHPDICPFLSYADFFQAAQTLLPESQSEDRLGLKEIQPGVWAGMQARISPTAKLLAPCWIGDRVSVGGHAEIGPFTVVENNSVVDSGATIANSIIAPDTYIGPGTEIADSIAMGNELINWKHNSVISVADSFLLSSLNDNFQGRLGTNFLGRIAALLCLTATAPLAFLWTMISHLRAQPVIRELRAVNPLALHPADQTIIYYEFANSTGLWQRWPQLWNIVFGEFAWVGNRPLTPLEAEQLTTGFEKLWLRAPIGLLSQADAEGCFDKLSDEAKAHAAYYTVHQSRRLNFLILWKVIVGCGKRNVTAALPVSSTVLEPEKIPLGKTTAS